MSWYQDCRLRGMNPTPIGSGHWLSLAHARLWIAWLVTRGMGDSELPPTNRASQNLVQLVFGEEDGHEEALYGRANHRVSVGGRGRHAGQGSVQEHGFSDASFYTWRAKFGGMEVLEARRLKELEAGNGRLKKLLAGAMLDIEALKIVKGKPDRRPCARQWRRLGRR